MGAFLPLPVRRPEGVGAGVVVFVGLPLVLLLMLIGLASFEKRVLSVDDADRTGEPALILTVEDHPQPVAQREPVLVGITPHG